MRAVVEDIAGCGIDWDGASICRRIWLLPVGESQLGLQYIICIEHETSYPACNCNVSNLGSGASEVILASCGSRYFGACSQ